MLYRVVISHNQTESIRKFPGGPSTVFVFDSPTEKDITECIAHGCNYVLMPYAGNRGANRNAGVQKILSTFDPRFNDIIEFFDGDRYPTTYNSDAIESLIDSRGIQCVLYSCEHDARHQKVYVPLSGATIVDTGTLCNPFYSCGFAMRVSAILEVMAFNNGSLFEPRFTRWGSEDQYLGLVCDYLHYKVAITCEVLLNGAVGGDADQHEDYRESLQTYIDLIREHNFPIRNEPRNFEIV